jgi:hypothetical protein
MATTVSTVPAVIDELVLRFGLAIPDAHVCDALPISDRDSDDWILIGFTSQTDEQAVSSFLTVEQMTAEPSREQYEISCFVSAWKGAEDDVKAVRDRAYELVNAMTTELSRDPKLGGLVLRATLTAQNLDQYYSEGGVSADVRVVISVDAFTRRT